MKPGRGIRRDPLESLELGTHPLAEAPSELGLHSVVSAKHLESPLVFVMWYLVVGATSERSRINLLGG